MEQISLSKDVLFFESRANFTNMTSTTRGLWNNEEALPVVFSRDTQINTDSPPHFQFLQAAAGGHTNELQSLIKQGEVDINVATKRGVAGDSGRTAASLAAESGYDDILTVLIKAGADINIPNLMGHTPLIYAVMRGNMECVKCLIAAKANLEAHAINTNSTPLWIARHSSKQFRKKPEISERFDAIAEVLEAAGAKKPSGCVIL